MARALIVDDAKIIRISLKRVLENLGHKVVGEADSGYAAIEQYKSLKPDFVTMDITMPAVEGIADGIEAVKEIMKIDKNAKIIMTTSHGEHDKVIKAIQSGASHYILKPIDANKFKEVLNKIL